MRMVSADGTRVVTVVQIDGVPYYRVRQRGIWIADERDLDGLAKHVDLVGLREMPGKEVPSGPAE
jgi:hypothetical protein